MGGDSDCWRCGSSGVKIVNPGDLTDLFEPVIGPYMISAVGSDRITSDEPYFGGSLLRCVEGNFGPVFSDRLLDSVGGREALFHAIINYHRSREDPKDRELLDMNDVWVPRTARIT